MSIDSIRLRRLRASRLLGPPFVDPVEAVGSLTAVQSQDFPAATWGLAERTAGATASEIEALFDDGLILRTHVLRPTWHFVLPADIRWLLALTAPRIQISAGHQYRLHSLDEAEFARSNDVLARALEGGTHATRPELREAIAKAGIDAAGLRFALLVMRAELDAVICSGPRRGKQFTYALLDERAPDARRIEDRDEAFAELARRYIASHGPAQARDFGWWSGLTMTDARRGLEAARPAIEPESIDGTVFWSTPEGAVGADARVHAGDDADPKVHLLPNYDEYTVAYADRRHIVAGSPLDGAPAGEILSSVVLLDRRPVGHWARVLRSDGVVVTTQLRVEAGAAEQRALGEAAERYGRFVERPVRPA